MNIGGRLTKQQSDPNHIFWRSEEWFLSYATNANTLPQPSIQTVPIKNPSIFQPRRPGVSAWRFGDSQFELIQGPLNEICLSPHALGWQNHSSFIACCQGPSLLAMHQSGLELSCPIPTISVNQPLLGFTRTTPVPPPCQSGWPVKEAGMGCLSSGLDWHATGNEGMPQHMMKGDWLFWPKRWSEGLATWAHWDWNSGREQRFWLLHHE